MPEPVGKGDAMRNAPEQSHQNDKAKRHELILEAVNLAAARLLQASSWEEEIDDILARLGRAAGASRAYLFETHTGADGARLVSQRAEWADEGIPSYAGSPDMAALDLETIGLGRWKKLLAKGDVIQGPTSGFPEGERDYLRRLDVCSVVVVPVFIRDAWWGYIGFSDCVRERTWSEEEVGALRTASRLLGAAIRRRKTDAEIERRRRELALLNRVIAAASTLEPRQALETACRELALVFDAPQAGAALLDDSGQYLEVVAEYSVPGSRPAVGERIPVEDNHGTRHVLEHREPLYVEDAQNDPRMAPVHDLMRERETVTLLILPLLVDEVVVGTIGVDFFERHALSDDEIALAANATATAAQVLAKARLLESERQNAKRLQDILQLSTELSTLRDEESLLETFVSRVHALFDTATCTVLFLDHEAQEAELVAQRGLDDLVELGARIPMSLPPIRTALEKRQPIILADIDRDAPEIREILISPDIKAIYGYPIIGKERPIGLFTVSFKKVRDPSPAEVNAFHLLGERVATALENARLLNTIQDQGRLVARIIDAVPAGILVVDGDGRVLVANPLAATYLELLQGGSNIERLEQLGGTSLADLLARPGGHEIEIETPAAGTFEVAARPLEGPVASESLLLVIHDVTQEREQQSYLQAQDRLATVGQMAAGIAHDFNNILAVIVLYSQMLLQSDLSSRDKERLKAIYEQAQRATTLVSQILDFSRRAVMERRPLQLVPFLEELADILERTLPETIAVKLTYDRGEYLVNADPTRLQQALMNLAVNARDAMPDGGDFSVRLEQIETGANAPLPDMAPGQWIRITVADTGEGIEPNDLPSIFDPFYTTKEPGQGTGLGLAQVYGIVKQHEGFIDVVSRPGEGTQFTIYLPARPIITKRSKTQV